MFIGCRGYPNDSNGLSLQHGSRDDQMERKSTSSSWASLDDRLFMHEICPLSRILLPYCHTLIVLDLLPRSLVIIRLSLQYLFKSDFFLGI